MPVRNHTATHVLLGVQSGVFVAAQSMACQLARLCARRRQQATRSLGRRLRSTCAKRFVARRRDVDTERASLDAVLKEEGTRVWRPQARKMRARQLTFDLIRFATRAFGCNPRASGQSRWRDRRAPRGRDTPRVLLTVSRVEPRELKCHQLSGDQDADCTPSNTQVAKRSLTGERALRRP